MEDIQPEDRPHPKRKYGMKLPEMILCLSLKRPHSKITPIGFLDTTEGTLSNTSTPHRRVKGRSRINAVVTITLRRRII